MSPLSSLGDMTLIGGLKCPHPPITLNLCRDGDQFPLKCVGNRLHSCRQKLRAQEEEILFEGVKDSPSPGLNLKGLQSASGEALEEKSWAQVGLWRTGTRLTSREQVFGHNRLMPPKKPGPCLKGSCKCRFLCDD